jgi:hypothetical protein
VRNPWFRFSHLAAIGYVALEELMHWRCPLTIWEEQLRALAGQAFHGETFMSWLTHQLIFSKTWPPQTFAVVHVSFALVVLVTLVLCPPRWFRTGGPVRGGHSLGAEGV